MGGGGGSAGLLGPGGPVCSSCHSPALRLLGLSLRVCPRPGPGCGQVAPPHVPQRTWGAMPTPAATAQRHSSGGASRTVSVADAGCLGHSCCAARCRPCTHRLSHWLCGTALAVVIGRDTKAQATHTDGQTGHGSLKRLCIQGPRAEQEGSTSAPQPVKAPAALPDPAARLPGAQDWRVRGHVHPAHSCLSASRRRDRVKA